MTTTAPRGTADHVSPSTPPPAENVISTAEQLRELLGPPMPRAVTKDHVRLHPLERDWLARSPFCIVATSGADGTCDASPKGDPAGHLALILDDTTIVIPERAGNRRADGYHNILQNPHVGLIFFVPGRHETLRINGRATLVRDAPYFDRLEVKGHRPVLAIEVAIEQIFLHCQKAFLRSELWNTDTWRPETLPSHACIARETHPQAGGLDLAELERYYHPDNYSKGLYPTSS